MEKRIAQLSAASGDSVRDLVRMPGKRAGPSSSWSCAKVCRARLKRQIEPRGQT